jgi:ABC-type Zn uptake system ZnuABC Zn-binding protein ZnuA
MYRLVVILSILALVLAACAGPASGSGTPAPVVLASTTFLADMARNVAGDRLTVSSLLPAGADPHTYEATPSDVAKIAESKVLILNGIEYEHFIEALLENAGGERLVVVASDGIEPRHMEEHAGETEAGDDHGHEAGDPHMWLDPNHVITYVENIREGLTHFDPDEAAVYQSNAGAYIAELKDLDAWIVEQVDQIPAEDRLLVTNHEALGYFAEQYGFTIVGTVIGSVSSDASPSAQQIAALIDQIRSSGASAIFLNAGDNPALAEQIAAETGVKVVTDLHVESLTDGAPAATYIDMMKHNVTRIIESLK